VKRFLNQKKAQVEELAQKLKKAKSIVLTLITEALRLTRTPKLRKALREAGC
jgi:ribosomal protein L10